MGTEDAINYKLKHLKVNDQKSDVDAKMQYSWNGPLEHFLLTERNEEHIIKSLILAVGDVMLFTEPDVITNAQCPFSNKITGGAKDNDEKDLLENSHASKIGIQSGIIGLAESVCL
jgi:hypothetical protein